MTHCTLCGGAGHSVRSCPWARRMLVCGGRDFGDHRWLYRVLDDLHAVNRIGLVIHGAARGADSLAHSWAVSRGVEPWPFPARWSIDGPGAGPIRNGRMLAEAQPHFCVAFPGGTGTQDMIKRAHKAGVLVLTPSQPCANVGALA